MSFLRRFLLSPFFNGSMALFASPAVGGGAGGGAGAGSGAGEGGGTGAGAPPIATWGPPKTDSGKGDEGSGGESEAVRTGGEAEGEDTELDALGDVLEGEDFEAGEIEGGGEQTFKQFVEAIRNELTSQDPKVVKSAEKKLKKLHGENQQFHEQFESPEEARELTERLESLGGIEGIETETKEAATLWNMLGAGDPGILDTLAEDHGEGLVKLFSPFVDKMSQMDPGGYAHKFAKIFMSTMNEAQAGQISALAALNQLMRIEGVKDSPEFQRIAEVINRINDIAARAPEGKRDDPTLTKREKEVRAREEGLKKSALSGKAAPLLQKSAKSALTTILGTRKLNTEAEKQVLSWTHEEFAKLAAKDAVGKRNREALLAAGEHEKWLKNVKSTANRFMSQAAKAALRKYAGISGMRKNEADKRRAEGDSRREAGGGGTSAGTIKTNKPPDPKIVDWERMRIEARKHGKDVEDMFTFDRSYFKKGDPRNLYKY